MLRGIFFIFCFLAISCNQNSGKQEANEPAVQAEQEKVGEESWLAEDDAAFLVDAYRFNLLVIQYHELAAEKASKKAIQNFAIQSARYHQAMNKEIEQMAGNLNATLPTDVGDLVQEHIDKMRTKQADEFDKTYLEVLSDIQEDMASKYEKASQYGSDMNLRNWAGKFISNVYAHQETVSELLEEVEDK